MSNSLYITSAHVRAGKAVVALGVMELLARQVARIGVFRPIISQDAKPDAMLELLISRYNIDIEPSDAYAMTYAEAAEHFEAGHPERVVETAVEKFSSLKSRFDFMVVIGTDYTGPTSSAELELNAILAANLGAPVLSIINGYNKDIDAIAASIGHKRHMLDEHDCSLIATIVNRVKPERADEIRSALALRSPDEEPIFVLRDLPVLAALTVEEVANGLGGKVIVGDSESMQREVDTYVAGSGHVPMVLGLLKPGVLVVCAGDRADLAVACAAVASIPDWPSPSALVLTCGICPDGLTLKLLQSSKLPTICVPDDTWETLHALDDLRGEIRPMSRRKIAAALGEFAASVDGEILASRIRLTAALAVTPLMFQTSLMEKARANRRHIVLPEGMDERVLRATDELLHGDIVDITLLGDPEDVKAKAARLGVDIHSAQIINPVTSPLRGDFAHTYAELRAKKGVTLETALDRMEDPNYFATMLVHTGLADGMVSGAAHTTAETIRPALEIIKTVPGTSLVSSTFLMCLPDRVLAFADCAVNPDPSSEQLAEIAQSTADTAIAFGIEPRVAMLSYSTGQSGSGTDVEKVRVATDLVAAARPLLPLAGPIQYDAAVDEQVGASKMPGNPVAGHATVLIFPDLNSGNTAYKAVQRSANAVAIGPILQGLRKPVNDLSRGCTVPDIVNTVAITALQAATVAAAAEASA